MTILINNVVSSTHIFFAIFLAAFLSLIRKRSSQEFFPVEVSQELKGLATLTIVFSHIGYFLSTDHRFLFPLTIMAGVGVDLFMLLSGYGLTISSLKNKLTVRQFYKKRLLKLYIPFWLVVGAFFLLDYFVLDISYSRNYIINSMLGLFTHADLYSDLNSPLWYFTFILSYYLLFPLVFRKNYYWLSALIIYAVTYKFVAYNPQYFINVLHLYKLHLIAFPLGMILAGLVFNRHKFGLVNDFIGKIFSYDIFRYLFLSGLLFIAGYFAVHSNVGGDPLREELTSLLVIFAVLGIFLVKRVDLKLFSIFGLYSYEIYLFHWPIMYRYDIFYRFVPAWLATILYLLLFIGLGRMLKKIEKFT